MSLKIAVRLGKLALATSLAAGAAYAQDATKVIKAATIVTYPPFSSKDPKSGELVGFTHDLFEAMAKKMGAKVNWSEFSFAELTSFAPLRTERVDIYGFGGMGDLPERREQGVSFLDFVYEPFFFFILSANADQFKSQDALCGKRIAITRSSPSTIALAKQWSEENCTGAGKPDVVVVGSENVLQSQMMMKQGRADASITGAGPLSNANKVEGNIYLALGKPLNKNMYGMAFLNEKSGLGEALKRALDELIADGTYVQLLKKWKMPVEDSTIGQTSLINAGTNPVKVR